MSEYGEQPILLVSATRLEHGAVAQGLGHRGPLPGRGQILSVNNAGLRFFCAHTGMGPQATEEILRSLLPATPCALLVDVGYCGGLTEAAKNGDLVLYRECLSLVADRLDPICYYPDCTLLEYATQRLGCLEIPYVLGRGLTVSRILSQSAEKKILGEKWNCGFVDMESATVFKTAAEFGVPCLALRIALDEMKTDLPVFSGLLTPEGEWIKNSAAVRKALGQASKLLLPSPWREAEKRARQKLQELGEWLPQLLPPSR